MQNLFVHKTKVGAFYIAEQDGRFHPMFRNEDLGSYATPQQAVDDLTGGHILNSLGGIDTATLAIPNRVQEWARLVF
jgi:hypothetical protein